MISEEKDPRLNDESTRKKQAAKLREMNKLLLTIAERFVGRIPEDLEELDELLEKKFGPDLWKRIYDEIPSKKDEDELSDKETSKRGDDEEVIKYDLR